MTILHMETEIVRNFAGQLKQAAELLHSQAQSLNSSSQSIDWQGPSREEFVMEMEAIIRQLNAQAEAGVVLSGRVESEVMEWENTAASLGIGVLGGATTGIIHPNMLNAAEQVLTGSEPIRIYQIGNNEYLVVIQGTDPTNSSVNNNWGSAVTTWLGVPSDFQKQVEAAISKLPPGATIHMTGHSQGGIVAQNLAIDGHISGNYHIGSVTTFGSMVSAPENPDVTYTRFAAQGDIVPYLESEDFYKSLLMGGGR